MTDAYSRPAKDQTIKGWVPGTVSVMVLFTDKNDIIVAKAHCFRRPDGTLAASERYDPKRVLCGDRYLVVVA